MSACRMDDSPWCDPGTCVRCDAGRVPTSDIPWALSWSASADLIAQLKTAIGERDAETDPFAHRALSLRVGHLQYALAELNTAETARLDALTFDVDPQADRIAEAFMRRTAPADAGNPRSLPNRSHGQPDDAWLEQLAEQATSAAGNVDQDGRLTRQQVAERHAARVACVLAVPALLAEIRRLRQEALVAFSPDDLQAAENFVAWAVDDLDAADDPRLSTQYAGAAVIRRLLEQAVTRG